MSKPWRFCPSCFALADGASVVRHCPTCSRRGVNARLVVLPLNEDTAQAALRIGGRVALETLIVGLVAGDEAAQAYEPEVRWEMYVAGQIQIKRPG